MNTEPLSPNSAAELAIQNRKFAKTCVEKKRRDRINKCLDELKEIMSQADDKARYQKMEKAEILEMAVNYMRICMSGGKLSGAPPHPEVYALAYNQLLSELAHCLAVMPGVRDDFKAHVLAQLSTHVFRAPQASAAQSQQAPQKQQQQQQQPSVHQPSKRKRDVAAVQTPNNGGKKVCVDTSNAHNYHQLMYAAMKYGGSCSSLDNTQPHPLSPSGSSTTSSDNQALNLSSSSSNSSPPISACSSPNSSKSTCAFNTKIFRPIDLP